MKIARRLTVFLVATMCVVLLLDAYLGVRRERALYETDLRDDLRQAAATASTAAAILWATAGRDGARRMILDINAAAIRPHVRWVDVDAPAGSPDAPRIARTHLLPQARAQVVQRLLRMENGDTRLYTYVPIPVWRFDSRTPVRPATATQFIEVSKSMALERRYLQNSVRRRVASAGMLTVLASLISAMLGAVFIGRPMRRLVAKARRIGEGDFADPLDLGTGDELEVLAGEMNAMCVRLTEAERRVKGESDARLTLLDELRHADRLATIGRLASGVAHELGTPLTVVAQRAKMIANGQTPASEARESATIIHAQSTRMAETIRQLLDFARRSPQLPVQRLRLEAVAGEALHLLTPLAEAQGVNLVLAPVAEPAWVEADAQRLQQAVANLVMNSLQAMDARGGRVELALSRQVATPPLDHGGPTAEYVRLAVRDDGAGIARENIPHVFEPFYTSKAIGQGTGLGLAVTYGIVREHGGWMAAESSPADGTTVLIYLPPAAPLTHTVDSFRAP